METTYSEAFRKDCYFIFSEDEMYDKISKQLQSIELTQNAIISTTTDWVIEIDKRQTAIENRQAVLENKVDTLNKAVEQYVIINKESDRLKANIAKLMKMRLFEDNWNGYNAKKLDESLIVRCISFISSTELKFQPKVFPTAAQTIQLEYEPDEHRYLQIDITMDGFAIYREIDGQEFELENISENEALQYINDFHSRL